MRKDILYVVKATLLVMTFFVAQPVMAQDPQGELNDVKIDIVVDRKIELPPATRNFEKIPPKASEPIKPPITYDFRAFNFQTPQITPVIKPLKLKENADKTEMNGGYLTAGYGNYASPYLEGFFNSRKDKNKLLGAHAYLYSSDKGPVDGTKSGSGMAGVTFYGNSFTENLSLSGNVAFENRSTHFYGYTPEVGATVDARDIKQFYNLFKISGEIANVKHSDFSYKLGLGFNYLADKFNAKESEADINLDLGYKVSDDNNIKVDVDYYNINRKDIAVSQNRSLFVISPGYEFYPIDGLKLRAGFIVAFENDTLDDKSTHVYPDLRASYPLSPSVDVFGALTGGIEKVTLQSLLYENLWLAPNVPIYSTNKVLDIQGGIRAKLGNKVSFEGGLSLASLKNLYFFKNTIADQAKFTMLYDDGATKRSNFFVSLGYTQGNVARFLVRGDYYGYKTKNVIPTEDADLMIRYEEPFHRPTYKLTVDGSYNVYEKIVLSAKILAMGGMKAWDHNLNQAVSLKGAFDLNFKAEYLFSESFSVFVQLNNITSSKYPLYLNYPVRGFQGMGGITWSF